MIGIFGSISGFGITISSEVWLIVAIILAVISLIVVGYNSDELDEASVPCGFVLLIASAAWPFSIIFGLAIGVIAIPVWLGQRAKKYKKTAEKKKKNKLKFMNEIDKMKKSRN